MSDIFTGKKCTFYKHYDGTGARTVDVLELLTNERYTNFKLLTELRKHGYGTPYYDNNKRNLSGACFSSVQDDLTIARAEENHLFHSGFIAFDIDAKSNTKLMDKWEAKYIWDTIVSEIPYVAYLGKSVSGMGLWGLIPIQFTEDHNSHYLAMITLFKQYNIVLDSIVSNVANFRFLSYDPDAHFELEPEIFNLLEQEPEKTVYGDQKCRTTPNNEFFEIACMWTTAKHGCKFEPGARHMFLTYLYATLRYARVSREDCLSWIYDNLIPESEIHSNCLDEIDIKSKI